jgi:queuine tRNA-ribosyltransferase
MFKLIKQSKLSRARLGVLKTARGEIKTPFFMPVATRGTVKHLTSAEMKRLGAQIILANTYHLMLKPGEKLIKRAGGLHNFVDWEKPILTDSGGFQVFSLAGNKKKSGENLVKLKDRGVKFKSYLDGREFYLTPQKALKIQVDLGVDIAVCLDVCLALPAKKEEIIKAVELTISWAQTTKKAWQKLDRQPLLFAVIQGGLDKELRLRNLKDLLAINFDGYNIGGLSVGESAAEREEVLDYLVPNMPFNKPRYLMGVGYPEDIVAAVRAGIDMFDCVIPTREGRHGRLFQWRKEEMNFKNFYQTINISRSRFARDFTPINANSKLSDLRNLTKSYLHYLFKIKEPLAQRLATLNNLEFYLDLMRLIRYNIKTNKF